MRYFARNIEKWIKSSVAGFPEYLVCCKLQGRVAFSSVINADHSILAIPSIMSTRNRPFITLGFCLLLVCFSVSIAAFYPMLISQLKVLFRYFNVYSCSSICSFCQASNIISSSCSGTLKPHLELPRKLFLCF